MDIYGSYLPQEDSLFDPVTLIAVALTLASIALATLVQSLAESSRSDRSLSRIWWRNCLFVAFGGAAYCFCFGLMYPVGDETFSLLTLPLSGFMLFDLLAQTSYAVSFIILLAAIHYRALGLAGGLGLSVLSGAILYPLLGRQHWGGGFLSTFGYYDFAGGMMIGGTAGAILLTICLIKKQNLEAIASESKIKSTLAVCFFILLNNSFAPFLTENESLNPIFLSASASIVAAMSSAAITGLLLKRTFSIDWLFYAGLAGSMALASFTDYISLALATGVGLLAGFACQFSAWALQKVAHVPNTYITLLACALYLPAILGCLVPAYFAPEFSPTSQLVGIAFFTLVGVVYALLLTTLSQVQKHHVAASA